MSKSGLIWQVWNFMTWTQPDLLLKKLDQIGLDWVGFGGLAGWLHTHIYIYLFVGGVVVDGCNNVGLHCILLTSSTWIWQITEEFLDHPKQKICHCHGSLHCWWCISFSKLRALWWIVCLLERFFETTYKDQCPLSLVATKCI